MKPTININPRSPYSKIKELLASSITVRSVDGWDQLSDSEAWQVLRLLTADGVKTADVPLMTFFMLNRFNVVGRSGSGFIVASPDTIFELTPEVAVTLARPFEFIHKPAPMPWRPGRFRKYLAIRADLSTLTFADWLYIENHLQRVISTGDFSLLDNLNALLMDRPKWMRMLLPAGHGRFTRPERLAVFLWLQSVKSYLQIRFPDFFIPVDSKESAEPVTPRMMQDSMDAQIRALTKGDATKEKEVLELSLYRALTELNALAREYQELKRQSEKR
ncbi:MAG: hypothetical protein K2G75_00165 [Muribaculaceae bacterium]|nr:hypothetical protein [Muribaculaceae bacterium]